MTDLIEISYLPRIPDRRAIDRVDVSNAGKDIRNAGSRLDIGAPSWLLQRRAFHRRKFDRIGLQTNGGCHAREEQADRHDVLSR